MKNMVKKNQIMITALAIMIAVAGYLNFAGGKIADEEIMTVASDTVVGTEENLSAEEATETSSQDIASLFEISDEDMAGNVYEDINSLDSEAILTEDFLDENMAEGIDSTGQSSENPGEAVFTSSTGLENLSGAKLQKEQTRAKNKETLLEIINNVNISEEQKQEAIDNMIAITDIAEKETSAEILLEAKGFNDVVVSITQESVDVVVNTTELSEAQRAQIEDIVIRKTGVSADSIIISTVSGK